MPKKDKSRKQADKSRKRSAAPVSLAAYPPKNDTDQEYGCVQKILGGNWTTVKCSDGLERRCHIRGALQRFKTGSTRIAPGDVVLISKRDDKTGDVVLKYPPEVARHKISEGQIVLDLGPADNDDTAVDGVEFEEAETAFDFDRI